MKHDLFYCFSTLGCPHASFDEAAAIARSQGFAGLELRALKGRIDLAALLREEFGNPQSLAEAVKSSGLRIAALDSSLSLLDARDEHRREVAELAIWADALEVPFLRVFDGGRPGDSADGPVRARILRELDQWEIVRRDNGFQCELMIETHGVLADPEICLRLNAESSVPIYLLWDICHTWSVRNADPVHDWQALKPLVHHIHVKDAARDSGGGLRHTLPGHGEIPVLPLLAALKRDAFAGPVSLEWESFWHPDLPPLERALTAGRSAGWW